MRSSEDDMGEIMGLYDWSSSSSSTGRIATFTSASSSSSPSVSKSESSHSASEVVTASAPPQVFNLLASGNMNESASSSKHTSSSS